MKIGVPKEIKIQEYRVGLVPANVHELCKHGHEVYIETGAGIGIGATDAEYASVGALIVPDADTVFKTAQMIVKVKEPQSIERQRLSPEHLLFTYLHLAPDPVQARELVLSGATCVAYETVTSPQGGLPLLAPMSEVAGRLAVQAGAYHLQKPMGGIGVLLGGVPGVAPARVTILGGGVVGLHAATIALGMGARVTVLDRSLDVLRALSRQFGPSIDLVYSTVDSVERHCIEADLLIGSVLIPGATAPKLVTHDIVRRMRHGSVIVDVAIDQGGCCETSRATTHTDPTYTVDGVVHYCVANMPGAVPRCSAQALNNATLPFVLALADNGLDALRQDRHLLAGLNVHRGLITNAAVAQALGQPYTDPIEALMT